MERRLKAVQAEIRRLESELKRGLGGADGATPDPAALLSRLQASVQELHRLRDGKVPAKSGFET